MITGKTKITGIFGYPIEHTLSPAMHNAAFKDLKLDYCYVPFLVHPESLKIAVEAIRALHIRGVNITIPHKEKVIPFLDVIDEEASFIGAVNTIVNDDGKLTGYNTDGRGFIQSLVEKSIFVENKKVLIIGAGGAARAIGYYLSQKAEQIFIYGRTKEKVAKLVNDLKALNPQILSIENIPDDGRFEIIINATPLGMKDDDPLPFNTEFLRKEQIVCDLIYKKTHLIQDALKKGCIAVDGTGMLLWQGAIAFELWTGKSPDINLMRKVLNKA